MARQVIRDPPSRPFSDYNIRDAENFASLPSGYRGLITLPGYLPSDLTSDKIDLSAPLTKYKKGEEPAIKLNVPLVSAAMQSVSGSRMGIALARMGGLADIYCSQPVESQAYMVQTVKRHKGAFVEPEVVSPEDSLRSVAERMRDRGYSKFFVTEKGDQHGVLIGLITDKDFDEDLHMSMNVGQRMRPVAELDAVYDTEVGYDIKAANTRAKESHHSALPIIYADGSLRDVIFRKDIRDHRENKDELLDNKKRLMVAAAVNTHDYRERVPALVDAGADVLLIDTSQGYNDYVRELSNYMHEKYEGFPFIGGNVVTADGFRFLVEECNVYGVKAGMGIASICITPEQIGIARGQDKAIEEVAKARDAYFDRTGIYVPIIADGGIRSTRDMLVALAFGADTLMLGKFFAGTDESPTEINYKLQPPKKPYWAEGSARAKAWREKRGYNIEFDEGVEAWVDYVGPLEPYVRTSMIQLKDGTRKAGCDSVDGLHKYAVVEAIAEEDVGVHDVLVERR